MHPKPQPQRGPCTWLLTGGRRHGARSDRPPCPSEPRQGARPEHRGAQTNSGRNSPAGAEGRGPGDFVRVGASLGGDGDLRSVAQETLVRAAGRGGDGRRTSSPAKVRPPAGPRAWGRTQQAGCGPLSRHLLPRFTVVAPGLHQSEVTAGSPGKGVEGFGQLHLRKQSLGSGQGQVRGALVRAATPRASAAVFAACLNVGARRRTPGRRDVRHAVSLRSAQAGFPALSSG